MTTINYLSLQAKAAKLIQSLGNIYTLKRPAVGNTDTKLCTCYGTFDTQIASVLNSTGGGVIASDQNVIYLPNLGKVVPQIGDRLLYGKSGWKIIKVEAIVPDNVTVILYTVTIT